jgi:N-acetyl-anhydromuramoyl-L-alanine amidase
MAERASGDAKRSTHERTSSGQAAGACASLEIDGDGLAAGVPFIASPNCDERPEGAAIELTVVHAISLPPGEFGGSGIEELFLNRLDASAHPYYSGIADLRVSAHFLVRRDGAPVQFVPCLKRAWHAGVSSWQGRTRCNDYSIGIELEGCDDMPFERAQYRTLAKLTQALHRAYPIRAVAAHSDIAPGRKTDPGPHFDWALYASLLGGSATLIKRR